jgi:hypothetical protein
MLKLLLTHKSLEFIGMYCPMAGLALAASLTRRAWLWRSFPLVFLRVTTNSRKTLAISSPDFVGAHFGDLTGISESFAAFSLGPKWTAN